MRYSLAPPKPWNSAPHYLLAIGMAATGRNFTRQRADCVFAKFSRQQGNAHARRLLVQTAQHLGQYHGPLGQTMRRIIVNGDFMQ